MKNIHPFEEKVLSGLSHCCLETESLSEKNPLGLAVSGGADSLSLLLSLSSIFKPAFLRVISLDHGIRSQEESGGDALFVEQLCDKLGIKCKIVKIPQGKICQTAQSEKKSIEEVARDFRYKAFEDFIQEENLTALCLAHNFNDQTETLLMRFLQGSSLEGMGGIPSVRGKFIRPLLEISRKEIEAYLTEKKQDWRTDSTNSDSKYLRNRVRNILVPLLNDNFSGWDRALISGAKKSACDQDYIQGEVEKLSSAKIEGKSAEISRNYFFSLHDSLKRRLFFSLLNKITFSLRFPYYLFEEILTWNEGKNHNLTFENVKISLNQENLNLSLFEKDKKDILESGFSFFFSKSGDRALFNNLLFRACKIEGEETCEKCLLKIFMPAGELSLSLNFPFMVRSFQAGDKIATADKKEKSLAEIFSDWKLPQKLREQAIVVEEISLDGKNEIKALLASHLAFKNWIVEEAKL
ncbi:MAG: tRNA lysidine(34) synthetase TilS [Treponema sp.]|nr:tRNA lysidine(34) synthetase TilS [Treponema sp.]